MRLKTLLLSFTTLVASAQFMYADEPVVSNLWNAPLMVESVDAENPEATGCVPGNIIPSADNKFFTSGTFVTTSNTDNIKPIGFMGISLPTVKVSAASNNNIVIVKHDVDGTADWGVFTSDGKVHTSDLVMAATPDGGLFVMFKAQHKNNDSEGNHILVTLESSNGSKKSLTFDWTQESGLSEYSNVAQPVMALISQDGNIIELKRVKAEWNLPDNTIKEDAFNLRGAISDGTNVYVCGSMYNNLTFYNGSATQTIACNNSNGNGFLLKIDGGSLDVTDYKVTSGDILSSSVEGVTVVGDRLHVYGNVIAGDAASEMSFAGLTVNANASVYNSLWTAALDINDLSGVNSNFFQGLEGSWGGDIKYHGITASNDKNYVYIVISCDGGLKISETESVTTQALNGMIVRLSANGKYDNCAIAFDGGVWNDMTYATAVVDNSDKVYVFGSDLFGTPLFSSFNRTTLAKESDFELYTTAKSPTAYPSVAFSGSKAIFHVRARKLTPVGSSLYSNNNIFIDLVSAFNFEGIDFSEEPTVTNDIADNSEITIFALDKTIFVTGAEGEQISIFSLAGVGMAHIADASCREQIPIGQKGFYIVKTNSTAQKVLIR